MKKIIIFYHNNKEVGRKEVVQKQPLYMSIGEVMDAYVSLGLDHAGDWKIIDA